MISAKLVAYTQPTIEVGASDPEQFISYAARVSNPSNQENWDTAEGLLKYCIRNQHWSIFEMVNAVVEVKAPRDITRQMLRHRSFSFQEFSQRYSDEIQFCDREVRMQDKTNRQNSVDCEDIGLIQEWSNLLDGSINEVRAEYLNMRKAGVAKEVARVLLPEGLTMSTMYVNGTLRSWLHYLEVREGNGTQKEHIELANKCRKVLEPVFPTVLGYKSYRKGFTRDIPITSAKTLKDCIEKTEKYLFPWDDNHFEVYDSKDEVVYRSELED